MKLYKCDNCSTESTTKLKVSLKGITGTSGGILLPEAFHEKHFCKPGCFWEWCSKYF